MYSNNVQKMIDWARLRWIPNNKLDKVGLIFSRCTIHDHDTVAS